MYLAMFLTMLPTLVTASPIPSLTRDNNVAKVKPNDLKVVVSHLLIRGNANRSQLPLVLFTYSSDHAFNIVQNINSY